MASRTEETPGMTYVPNPELQRFQNKGKGLDPLSGKNPAELAADRLRMDKLKKLAIDEEMAAQQAGLQSQYPGQNSAGLDGALAQGQDAIRAAGELGVNPEQLRAIGQDKMLNAKGLGDLR